MRILPHELLKYAPDNTLTALRKEFGMYDYCLNVNPNNRAMQPFLDLGRNYFNLLLSFWIKEMKSRNHYVNSFHLCYSINNDFVDVTTDEYLLLECIIQWDLKQFIPYNTVKSWFEIANLFITIDLDQYNFFCEYYKENYMGINDKGKLKPKQLDIIKVIDFIKNNINNK
ncbi:hypothetical protein SLITO_v1c04290 [Spiroplasma litorale]|uniref:Uncharacterized protein n=1 Tax=Spiroplasma litorale TaxID=216942 RepID=A0A0K1W1V0_9MOLU|nr:hypothetical protein [Spiroplasma litorale]AKX34082.1 hypothetical protein SLITO_v1c04290 [Spiroplasma litorale]